MIVGDILASYSEDVKRLLKIDYCLLALD